MRVLAKDFWQAIAEVKAHERATLAALAAECRTEPPRACVPVDQETQALQQASSAAVLPQLSMAQRAPRREASMEENIQNGKKWMNEEVMLCFKKYVEISPDLTGRGWWTTTLMSFATSVLMWTATTKFSTTITSQ